ncbi:MAG: hypothetical protein IBX55_01455 [Methyloprofundus sp.]|nr:hypothetical protein [Methyloprofundus sp.]
MPMVQIDQDEDISVLKDTMTMHAEGQFGQKALIPLLDKMGFSLYSSILGLFIVFLLIFPLSRAIGEPYVGAGLSLLVLSFIILDAYIISRFIRAITQESLNAFKEIERTLKEHGPV